MLYKAVSRSSHRRDMFGGRRVVFKFFSQPVYVNGNGGVVAHGFHAPYLYIQFLAAEQHSFVCHKECEQFVFLVFQFYLISPLINSVSAVFKVISPTVSTAVFPLTSLSHSRLNCAMCALTRATSTDGEKGFSI